MPAKTTPARSSTRPARRASGRASAKNRKGVRKPSSRAKGPDLAGCFPKALDAEGGDGIGFLFARMDREGKTGRWRAIILDRAKNATQPSRRGRAKAGLIADQRGLARLLSGLAHPDRLIILETICGGGSSHADLSKATSLKAGPLYHHLKELERAGLIHSRERNQHQVTPTGELALHFAGGLAAMRQESGRLAPWRSIRGRTGAGQGRR